MPVFICSLKCELENVSSLSVRDSVWTLDVKNGSSDETRKGVTIDADDEIDVEGSRASANLVSKFHDAIEKAHASILPSDDKKAKVRSMTSEDSGEWVPFLAIEARGLEITAVHLGGDNFTLVTSGGTTFIPDLSEPDWAEYDQDHQLPVSITQLETKVEVYKKK